MLATCGLPVVALRTNAAAPLFPSEAAGAYVHIAEVVPLRVGCARDWDGMGCGERWFARLGLLLLFWGDYCWWVVCGYVASGGGVWMDGVYVLYHLIASTHERRHQRERERTQAMNANSRTHALITDGMEWHSGSSSSTRRPGRRALQRLSQFAFQFAFV